MPDANAALVEADPTDTSGPNVQIVGDSYVASTLSNRLKGVVEVRLLTDDAGVASHARIEDVRLVVDADRQDTAREDADYLVVTGELLSSETLSHVAGDEYSVTVVAMNADSRTFLAAQLLRVLFDQEEVVTLIKDPRRAETIEDIVTETICSSGLAASAIGSFVEDRIATLERA